MSLGVSIRGAARLPASYGGGAGIVEEIAGLARRTRLEYRSLQVLDTSPVGGLVAVQDPDTGEFQTLSFEQLPTSQPGTGTVGNPQMAGVPARTVKGNATGATTAPQDLSPDSLLATPTLSGFLPGIDKAKLDTLLATTSNLTPVVGSKAYVGRQTGNSPSFTPTDVGKLFPSLKVGMEHCFAKEFDGTFTGYNDAALAAVSSIAVNSGSDGSVMPFFGLAIAQVSNVRVTGGNVIVATQQNLSNVKVVLSEYDFQAGSGTTLTGDSGGHLVNTFTPNSGPALQTYGVFGGYWTNGLIHYSTSTTFVGLAPGAGSTMGSLFNTGNCTYASGAAGIFSNGAHARFQGTGGNKVDIYTDATGYLHIIHGGQPIVLRDATDTSTLLSIGTDGAIASGANAALGASQAHIASPSTTEGQSIGKFTDGQGYRAAEFYVSRAEAVSSSNVPNAARAAAKLWKDNSTGRSLNAAGTINASGSDYAEWKRKRDDLKADLVKGQLVGLDAENRITDRFDLAVRFGWVTTRPSFLGGDDFTGDLMEPEAPVYEAAPFTGTAHPGEVKPQEGVEPQEPDLKGVGARGAHQEARAVRQRSPQVA